MNFSDIFVGGNQAHGEWDQQRGAKTVKKPASSEDYDRHLNGICGLGLVPIREDNTCRFAAIDIDVDTIDHQELYKKLQARKIPATVCRSKSGGAHVYVFMSEPGLPAAIVQSFLKRWASLLGYPGAEIFPKQVKITPQILGNWINLPYFNVERSVRYAVGKTGSLSLDEFFSQIVFITEENIAQVDESKSKETARMPPCLQALSQLGLPEGSRNQGLFNFGVFFRKSSPQQWEDLLTDHNQKNVSPPLTYRESQAIIKSLSQKTYQYTCNQAPINAYCDRDTCLKLPFGVQHMPWQEKRNYDEILVTRCRKIVTDPPRYMLEVNGHDLALSSEEFLSYTHFRRRVMELLDIVPQPIKQASWETTVRTLLQNKDNIEAPQEASLSGQVLEKFYEFLSLRNRARGKDDLLRGLPVEDKEEIIFRVADLKKFLVINRIDRIETTWLFQILREVGVSHHRLHLLGRHVSAWSFPLKNINEQQEPFESTKVENIDEEL